jgi:hypothetical protein
MVLIVCSLEHKLQRIGKFFIVQWVTLSEITIKLIWNNFPALYQHFTTAANDGLRTSKENSKYLGLKKHLASIEFVSNLGK